jgi:hypothetical protein
MKFNIKLFGSLDFSFLWPKENFTGPKYKMEDKEKLVVLYFSPQAEATLVEKALS